MKGGNPNKPQPDPDPANLSEAELSSNQEARAVPWFCGEQKIAVSWISPAYSVYGKETDSAKK